MFSLEVQKPSVARIEVFIDYFDRTWLNGQFQHTMWNTCLWKMGSGPKTTRRDGITKSRKSLGRVTSTFFEKVEVFKFQLKVSLRQLMAGGALRSVLLHK